MSSQNPRCYAAFPKAAFLFDRILSSVWRLRTGKKRQLSVMLLFRKQHFSLKLISPASGDAGQQNEKEI